MDATGRTHHGLADRVLSTLSLVVVAWLVLAPAGREDPEGPGEWGRA